MQPILLMGQIIGYADNVAHSIEHNTITALNATLCNGEGESISCHTLSIDYVNGRFKGYDEKGNLAYDYDHKTNTVSTNNENKNDK